MSADVKKAVGIAVQYGGFDGDHHKAWVIDQMVRALTGENYEEIVRQACDSGAEWDVGIPP